MANTERRAQKPEIALGITSSYPEISFSLVDRNPDQPRQDFDDGDIAELALSIESNSLLQAVTVRHHPTAAGRYLIVAGERRFRAMKIAGMTKAIFKLIEGPGAERSYILSVIENIHRVSLNPIEEALSYQRLHDEERLTWEEIHALTGSDVGGILTKIKLLTLPEGIQDMVRRGTLPQVTALNLSQWRNEEDEYMRMAHDLIAGRDPAAVHFRKDTVRGQQQVQARLPRTPEDFAKRIVKLSGLVQSMPAVFEAFLKLPPKEQRETLEAIHPSVSGKLRVRFVALYRSIQAVSELMNAHAATKSGQGYTATEADAEPVREVRVMVPVVEPAAPAPIPPAQVVPMRTRVVSRDEAAARVVVPETKPVPEPPPVKTPPPTGKVGQTLDVSRQVMLTLFYSGDQPHVNLSRERLVNAINNGDDPDSLAHKALQHARTYWRRDPKGSEQEQKFIRLMHRFKRHFGDAQKFEDALTNAMLRDTSDDPVSL